MGDFKAERKQVLQRLSDVLDEYGAAPAEIPPDPPDGFWSLADLELRTLRRVMVVLDEVRRVFDRDGADDELDDGTYGFEGLQRIAEEISSTAAVTEVETVAWVAKAQLAEGVSELERLRDVDGGWEVAALINSTRDRSVKALVALESMLRTFDGHEPRRRRFGRIDDALEIRREYASLRRRLADLKTPGEQTANYVRLRYGAERLEEMRYHRVYPLMRVSDRLEMRRLLGRIQLWLTDPERQEEVAEQLWSDLTAFTDLLLEINQRQEILDHDREVLHQISDRLDQAGGEVDPETRVLLRRLEGRTDTMDRLLLRSDAMTVEQVRMMIDGLLSEVDR